MQGPPEITVVIPVHNREGIVCRTLQSVLHQTHRPLAVVLVDNNSTDGSLAVLRQWASDNAAPDFPVTVLSEQTTGAPAARNRGLQAVASEFVMFFDSDDTMSPRHVERAMEAFHSPSRPDIVGWDVTIHDLRGRIFNKPFCHRDTIWHCILHGTMGTQRYAVRTRLVRRAGAWNNAMTGWNDIELGTRLLLLRPRITKLPPPVTVHIYRQTQSITGTDFSSTPRKWEQSLDEIERNLPTPRQRRYVQLRRALLSGNYAREGNRPHSLRLLHTLLSREPSPAYRLIYRLARAYTAIGGRAAASLLRPLF